MAEAATGCREVREVRGLVQKGAQQVLQDMRYPSIKFLDERGGVRVRDEPGKLPALAALVDVENVEHPHHDRIGEPEDALVERDLVGARHVPIGGSVPIDLREYFGREGGEGGAGRGQRLCRTATASILCSGSLVLVLTHLASRYGDQKKSLCPHRARGSGGGRSVAGEVRLVRRRRHGVL